MKHLIELLSQKPMLGVISGASGIFASITFTGVIASLTAIFGLLVVFLTFLIKYRDAGGAKGIWSILRNWKKE